MISEEFYKTDYVNKSFLESNSYRTVGAKKYFSKTIQKKSIAIANPVDDRFYYQKRNHVTQNTITIGRRAW